MKAAAFAPLVAAAFLVATTAWSSQGDAQHDANPWLLISSTRDGAEYTIGDGQAFALRPDGSRLTSLRGRESKLDPVDVSPDGRLIAYQNAGTEEIDVSRADGTGLRRVLPPNSAPDLRYLTFSPDGSTVAIVLNDRDDHPRLFVVDADGGNRRRLGRAGPPDFSADGRLLAYHTVRGCVVATAPFTSVQGRIPGPCGYPELSPNGALVAFGTGTRCAVVTTPLPARLAILARERRLLPGRCEGPVWSPNGRWLAYLSPGCPYCDSSKEVRAGRKELGVWIVHPDGSGRRRVGPADEENGAFYSWSPDSSRLAIASGSRLLVASTSGGTRHIGPPLVSDSYTAPLWSPDGNRLTVAARTGIDPAQIWSVGADGSGVRRLTSAGVNGVIGLVDGPPARRPVLPLEPSERVLSQRLLGTEKPIGRLAADGGSIAYIADSTETDCEHVSVWTPARERIQRVSIRLPAPCDDYGDEVSVYELALAGSMVGWSTNLGCGNSGCGVDVHTARLPDANPVEVGFDDGEDYGNEFLLPFDPVGRGRVFAVENHVRVAEPNGGVRRCNLPADAESVDGARLAVRRTGKELIVDDHCQVVARVALDTTRLQAVLLDGSRLIAARPGSLEVYDANAGFLREQRSLPPGTLVDGAVGGIVALRRGTTVTALRLDDGRTVSFTPCLGPVLAAIGDAGLYYSYRTPDREGRLALVPRKELEQRLATGRSYEPGCTRSTQSFATAGGPNALAAGDLDGDGRVDLVTGNEPHSVSVLRGPDFTDRRDYRLGTYPVSLVLSDLDRDGHLDVAVTLGNEVAVLRNRGDGSLAPRQSYPAGRSVGALAAGDLDGDGAPDLVVANSLDDTVSILLNRGDGILRPQRERVVGSTASSLAIAEVTGDGIPDIVVGHEVDRTGTILEGAGDGTFPRTRAYPVPEYTEAVAVADLDGKGRPDLALKSCGTPVMLARSGGGFSKPRRLAEDDECSSPNVSAGDVDGDGRTDLVTVASSSSPLRIAVYLNRGGGRFLPTGTYEAPSSFDPSVLVRDLNGDGYADLAVPVFDPASVAVLTNTLGICHARGLRGRSAAAAARRLARAGCHIGHVRDVHAPRISKGNVVAAVPRFGAYWPDGPEVDLLVSR